MEEKQESTLGGFEAILDSFIPSKDGGLRDPMKVEEPTDEPIDDDELDQIKEKQVDPVASKAKAKAKEETSVEDEPGDEEPEEEEEIDEKPITEPRKPGRPKSQETIDAEADEAEQVGSFFDVLADKFGWSFSEDEKDSKPKNFDELIEYMQDVVEENSKPDYASDEVAALDEFVRNGGKLQDYFKTDHELDLDNIDIEDEHSQKTVVRQLLKEKGFSDKQIEKKIQKYEDAGLLEDEAEDAIEDLKEIKQQKKEQLLADQKREYAAALQRQQQFCDAVVSEIKSLKDVRGIAIPDKDKRTLIDYILKPDADGRTKYQKDYAKGGVKNLIESAYFTMNADKLLAAAKQQGNNSAIERFKRSLKPSVGTRSKAQQTSSNDDPIWLSAARSLRMS